MLFFKIAIIYFKESTVFNLLLSRLFKNIFSTYRFRVIKKILISHPNDPRGKQMRQNCVVFLADFLHSLSLAALVSIFHISIGNLLPKIFTRAHAFTSTQVHAQNTLSQHQ